MFVTIPAMGGPPDRAGGRRGRPPRRPQRGAARRHRAYSAGLDLTWLGLLRLIFSHTILFNLTAEHYLFYQPNRVIIAER